MHLYSRIYSMLCIDGSNDENRSKKHVAGGCAYTKYNPMPSEYSDAKFIPFTQNIRPCRYGE